MLTLLAINCPGLVGRHGVMAATLVELEGGAIVRQREGLLIAAFGTKDQAAIDEAVTAALAVRSAMADAGAPRFVAIIGTVSTGPEPRAATANKIPSDILDQLEGAVPEAPGSTVLVMASALPFLSSPLRWETRHFQNDPASGSLEVLGGRPRAARPIVEATPSRPRHSIPTGSLNSTYGSMVGAMTGAGRPSPAAEAVAAKETSQLIEPVTTTVFAPPKAASGSAIMVQVFAHRSEQAGEAASLAAEFDSTAARRGFRCLESEVRRGERLGFTLEMPGALVDPPAATLVWRGTPESVQFAVTVPAGARADLLGTVTVSVAGVPVGHLKFRLEVAAGVSSASAPPSQPVGELARSYRKAFVSYASQDRQKVLERVQMLTTLGIRCFQDVMDLEPGQRWANELQKHIEECDVFLLFWSSAARDSEWVLREADYALERQGRDAEGLPAIIPVIVEGPPVIPPPPRLAHLHFNDRLLYFMER